MSSSKGRNARKAQLSQLNSVMRSDTLLAAVILLACTVFGFVFLSFRQTKLYHSLLPSTTFNSHPTGSRELQQVQLNTPARDESIPEHRLLIATHSRLFWYNYKTGKAKLVHEGEGVHYGVFPGDGVRGEATLWVVVRPHNWHPASTKEYLVELTAETGCEVRRVLLASRFTHDAVRVGQKVFVCNTNMGQVLEYALPSMSLVRKLQLFTEKDHVNTLAPLSENELWLMLHNLGPSDVLKLNVSTNPAQVMVRWKSIGVKAHGLVMWRGKFVVLDSANAAVITLDNTGVVDIIWKAKNQRLFLKGLTVVDDVAFFGMSPDANRRSRNSPKLHCSLAALDLLTRRLLWINELPTHGLLNVIAAPQLGADSTYRAHYVSKKGDEPSIPLKPATPLQWETDDAGPSCRTNAVGTASQEGGPRRGDVWDVEGGEADALGDDGSSASKFGESQDSGGAGSAMGVGPLHSSTKGLEAGLLPAVVSASKRDAEREHKTWGFSGNVAGMIGALRGSEGTSELGSLQEGEKAMKGEMVSESAAAGGDESSSGAEEQTTASALASAAGTVTDVEDETAWLVKGPDMLQQALKWSYNESGWPPKVGGKWASGLPRLDNALKGTPSMWEAGMALPLMVVDTAAIQARLDELTDKVWDPEDQAVHNAVLAGRGGNLATFKPGVDAIVLLFSDQSGEHVYQFPYYDKFKDVLEPILHKILGEDAANIIRLQFARMKPGVHIKLHHDMGLYAKNGHRIHVPVQLNPGLRFDVCAPLELLVKEQGRAAMVKADEPGSCLPIMEGQGLVFELNNRLAHRVTNNGNTNRIQVIVDVAESPKQRHRMKPGVACQYIRSMVKCKAEDLYEASTESR